MHPLAKWTIMSLSIVHFARMDWYLGGEGVDLVCKPFKSLFFLLATCWPHGARHRASMSAIT